MSDDLKYVCFSTINSETRHFLIFDPLQQHFEAAKQALYVLNGGMNGGIVHSAGFVFFDLDYESEGTIVQVYGRSSSLKLDCDHEVGEVMTNALREKGLRFATWKRNGMHYFTSYSPEIDSSAFKSLFGEDLFSEGRFDVDVSIVGPLTVRKIQSSVGNDNAARQAEDALILRAFQAHHVSRS